MLKEAVDAGIQDDSDDETQSTTETEDSEEDSEMDDADDGILSNDSDEEDAQKVLDRATGRDGKGDIEDAADGECAPPTSNKKQGKLKPMLNERQKKNLEKEGYKIVGTHSAVKLCRWTKHHLRGRGGCYKHTFYNIASYSCMEATPSLAC